jgi:hypothetical protein
MRKLAIIIALPLITASSAFAGDFAQAYDASKGPSTLIAAIIALAIMIAGPIILVMRDKGKRLPLATIATVIAMMLASANAGDFANAADSGYGPSNNMWNRFGSWFGSFWTSHFSWENVTESFGKFTPVPSAPPSCGDGRCGGNGASPPRQQN